MLARELGKPCVTGVAGIVDAVESGTAIVVDGTRGVVEVEGSRAAEPPVEDESELVAVMQFGQFGAAFEPRGQRTGVDTAVSVAALASVPAAFGTRPGAGGRDPRRRVLVRRDRLRAVVAELTDRIADRPDRAGELRARFERLVSPGDGDALEAGSGRYARRAYQLVWAASLVREPLAERYRAFLLGRLGRSTPTSASGSTSGSLTPAGTRRTSCAARSTAWRRSGGRGSARRRCPDRRRARKGHRRAEGARARERLAALLPPADRELAWRYLAALADLVDLTERKNTDLHRCAPRALRERRARGGRRLAARATERPRRRRRELARPGRGGARRAARSEQDLDDPRRARVRVGRVHDTDADAVAGRREAADVLLLRLREHRREERLLVLR